MRERTVVMGKVRSWLLLFAEAVVALLCHLGADWRNLIGYWNKIVGEHHAPLGQSALDSIVAFSICAHRSGRREIKVAKTSRGSIGSDLDPLEYFCVWVLGC